MIDIQAYNKALREVDIHVVEKLVQQNIGEGLPAQTILNEGLVGAMGIVGKEFKANELWVPDVLLAARNMNRGISLLRPLLKGAESSSRGTFIIGTVAGDIHDVGKNIVYALMQGSGFKVVDLGVDVPTGKFVSSVEQHRPQVLGLSALLTTTMQGMEDVIKEVKKKIGQNAPKIIVGGAPVTAEFAREIGADGYGADAVSGADVAVKLVRR